MTTDKYSKIVGSLITEIFVSSTAHAAEICTRKKNDSWRITTGKRIDESSFISAINYLIRH